ncbi:hypothetical protein I4I84_05690 [Pseudonocardia sp. KRD-182]|uniref:hypothetical protein n=1 Tax=Pseudonocardia oceani TaxID=2792013 RepID=UPI001C49FC63|nr:hypothetical protein [Pseudonocardia oceani]MBW0108231.1 hypothetical protein [Pseudonocardia oceani]
MPTPTDLDGRTVHSPDAEQRTEQRRRTFSTGEDAGGYHRADRRHRAFDDLAMGTGALTPLPDLGPAPVEGGRR